MAQVGERPRRRHDDNLLCMCFVQKPIQSVGDSAGEPMFSDVVPVGLLHRAAVRLDARQCSSRPIRPLFMGRRVVIFQDPPDFQAWLQPGTFIEDKKCLAAVSDKNNCAMR